MLPGALCGHRKVTPRCGQQPLLHFSSSSLFPNVPPSTLSLSITWNLMQNINIARRTCPRHKRTPPAGTRTPFMLNIRQVCQSKRGQREKGRDGEGCWPGNRHFAAWHKCTWAAKLKWNGNIVHGENKCVASRQPAKRLNSSGGCKRQLGWGMGRGNRLTLRFKMPSTKKMWICMRHKMKEKRHN